MKLKMGEIVNAWGTLQYLATVEMSVESSLITARNLQALQNEMRLFQAEKEKFEERHSDDEKNLEKKLQELLNAEVTVDIQKIAVSDLGVETMQPGVFVQTSWLFKENGHES